MALVFGNRRRRQDNIVYVRNYPLSWHTNESILANKYRLQRQDVFHLLHLLRNVMRPSNRTMGNWPITERNRLLAFVRYLATNADQWLLADSIGCCQATVSNHFRSMLNAFCRPEIVDQFIQFPLQDPRWCHQTARSFGRMSHLGNVIGCVDGSFIPTILPTGPDAYQYRGRKGTGINVLLIVDADGRILYVNSYFPASTHDSIIYRRSLVKAHFDANNVPHPFVLLGDSGFANGRDVMTPYRNVNNYRQAIFNTLHQQTRVIVEQIIGCLKGRFHILSTRMRHDPEICAKVVIVTCVLHNYLLSRGTGVRQLGPVILPQFRPRGPTQDPRRMITRMI